MAEFISNIGDTVSDTISDTAHEMQKRMQEQLENKKRSLPLEFSIWNSRSLASRLS